MSGSAPSNYLFDVSTVRLLPKYFPFLFPVRLLIVESMLLFPSVALFPVLSVSVDPSPLVSAAPPTFVFIADPTCSSPRCPVCSHSLVCSENPFSIVGIGPIPVKEL